MRNSVLVLLAVMGLLLVCQSALAQGEEPALPMTREAFWAAKAAAGGVLDDELTRMAVAMTVEHIHWVQLSIERYAVDHYDTLYPQHINQLVFADNSYAEPGFYANPFTAASADTRDAMEVAFGWSERAPGNFTYLQIYGEKGNVTGYMLLGYGADRDSGQDIDGDGLPDGVVISLASSMKPFPKGLTTFLSDGRPVQIDMGE